MIDALFQKAIVEGGTSLIIVVLLAVITYLFRDGRKRDDDHDAELAAERAGRLQDAKDMIPIMQASTSATVASTAEMAARTGMATSMGDAVRGNAEALKANGETSRANSETQRLILARLEKMDELIRDALSARRRQ